MPTKDAEQIASDFEAVKRDLGQLRDEFGALLGHLRSGAGRAADDLTRSAKHQIEERPVVMLLGAFFAGFLISLLFGRR